MFRLLTNSLPIAISALLLMFVSSLYAAVDTLKFNLVAVEGQQVTVAVIKDIHERHLRVESAAQRLCFDGFSSLLEAKVLNGCFLQLRYGYQAGSDADVQKLVLICVFRDTLHTAFITDAYIRQQEPPLDCPGHMKDVSNKYFTVDTWTSKFTIKLSGKNFGLGTLQHHIVKSKCNSSKSVDSTYTSLLRFSHEHGVFYSRIDTVAGFHVYARGSFLQQADHQQVICPVIQLPDGTEMWFFDHSWCFKDQDSQFSCGEGRRC